MKKIIQKFNLGFWALILLLPLAAAFSPHQADAASSSKTSANKQVQPKTIFDFQSQLNLTNTQMTEMKKDLEHFQKRLIEDRAKFQLAAISLQSLIKKQAPISSIKIKLKKEASLQIDMKLADIETARKIEGVLTPGQLKKWRQIQKENR
jgi:hypothetical protein